MIPYGGKILRPQILHITFQPVLCTGDEPLFSNYLLSNMVKVRDLLPSNIVYWQISVCFSWFPFVLFPHRCLLNEGSISIIHFPPSICLHCQFRLILSNHAETRYIFLYIFPTCSDVSGGSKRIFCRGIRDISIEVLCPTCLSLKVYQSIQYLKCVCSRFLFTSAGKLTS